MLHLSLYYVLYSVERTRERDFNISEMGKKKREAKTKRRKKKGHSRESQSLDTLVHFLIVVVDL